MVIVPLFLIVAYVTYSERKIIGFMQSRMGPTRVGPSGLLQPIADVLKLVSKEIDLIIANDVSKNKVFGEDTNKVFLIDKNNCEEWCEQSKNSVAFNLADKINKIFIT